MKQKKPQFHRLFLWIVVSLLFFCGVGSASITISENVSLETNNMNIVFNDDHVFNDVDLFSDHIYLRNDSLDKSYYDPSLSGDYIELSCSGSASVSSANVTINSAKYPMTIGSDKLQYYTKNLSNGVYEASGFDIMDSFGSMAISLVNSIRFTIGNTLSGGWDNPWDPELNEDIVSGAEIWVKAGMIVVAVMIVCISIVFFALRRWL